MENRPWSSMIFFSTETLSQVLSFPSVPLAPSLSLSLSLPPLCLPFDVHILALPRSGLGLGSLTCVFQAPEASPNYVVMLFLTKLPFR